MDKLPALQDFCHSAAIYSRIRNALWHANYDWPIIPRDWEPSPDDFLGLNPKTIVNIGPRSIGILHSWVNAVDQHLMK